MTMDLDTDAASHTPRSISRCSCPGPHLVQRASGQSPKVPGVAGRPQRRANDANRADRREWRGGGGTHPALRVNHLKSEAGASPASTAALQASWPPR